MTATKLHYLAAVFLDLGTALSWPCAGGAELRSGRDARPPPAGMLPLPLALVAAAAAAAAFVLASRCLSSRGGKKDDIEAETVDYCARDPINIILHTQGVPALATSSEGAESCDEDAARCWGVGDERRERSSGDTRGGRVGSECEVMREAGLLLPKLRDRSLWGKAARGKRRLAHLLNNQEQRLEQAHGEPELVTGS
uniref:Uncharacterized protein n=1 Tax=Oryza rufipogon TaxID=4529 RepID=A0A0E0P8U1_ORYRU